MAWFKPAWDNLSEDEQYVLEVFFMGGTASEDATRLAAGHFGIERTSVYMKKKRALDHLTVLLYGKC